MLGVMTFLRSVIPLYYFLLSMIHRAEPAGVLFRKTGTRFSGIMRCAAVRNFTLAPPLVLQSEVLDRNQT